MGNHQTHGLQPQVVTSLRKETGFSSGEISDLYRQFREDSKDLYMTAEKISDMYRAVFPHGDPERFGAKVFATFDKSGAGKVDFHEFIHVLGIQLKGTVRTKYEWVYDVFDSKKKGQIGSSEVRDVVMVSAQQHFCLTILQVPTIFPLQHSSVLV